MLERLQTVQDRVSLLGSIIFLLLFLFFFESTTLCSLHSVEFCCSRQVRVQCERAVVRDGEAVSLLVAQF